MQLIKGTTKLLGVIGDPVKHSLSPVMHNAAIAHLGLDYVYLPFPIKKDNLQSAILGFEAIDLVGFNITIPHKQAILSLLSEITPTAKMVGAVNTAWKTSMGWQGTNTDVAGFIAPLQKMDRDWARVKPVILGNGGAARAVVVGLMQLGCQEIHLVGRNRDKLALFYKSWQQVPEVSKKLKIHYWENLASLISDTKLLVNTTPVGMYPHVEASPVEDAKMQKLASDAIAYDLIYTPNPTKFLKLASDRGAVIIDGLEMLIAQGAIALEIWLQKPVPIEVMRRSLKEHLGLI